MTFDSPLLLLTLLVVPVAVGLYLLAARRRMRYAVRFTNLDVLAQVTAGERAWRRYVPPVLFLLALASLCAGLARPHVKTLVPTERATVILVIDASRSMQAQDVRPSRLEAAEAAARAFIDHVAKRLRLGLIVFAGDVQVAAPPTTDHQLVRESVDAIGTFTGFGGTAIGDAIARAVELGKQAVNDGRTLASATASTPPVDPSGLVSILFLSDGRQNRGVLPPLEGAARAKAAGIPVYTVALGTANGASPGGSGGFAWARAPDPKTLEAIAQTTGGQFFEARTAESLKASYAKLGSRLGRTPGRTEVTYAFLLAAAAVLVAAGLLSARWSPQLP